MLFFSRWKVAAILLTAAIVCLFAVPNFFSENTLRNWPSWAQRHIVLGLDLQGGSSLLLEVDVNAVRKDKLQAISDDVLRILRQNRIQFTGRAIKGNSVEVRITRDSDVENAVGKLRELSQPVSSVMGSTGQRSVDISESGGLITLTPTEPALVERIRQTVDQSIQIIERRVNELGLVEPIIQRQGASRILVQVPGLQDPSRLKEIIGKTAKLDFRMVDLSMTPEQALASHPPADFGNSRRGRRIEISHRQTRARFRRRSCRCAAGLRSAQRPTDRQFPFQFERRAQVCRGDQGECRQAVCDCARQQGDLGAGHQ